MADLPGFFVALFFNDSTDTHVTLLIRKRCTVEDLQKMVNYLKYEIAPLLPLAVSIDPELTMKGIERDVPTHNVYFSDARAKEYLGKLYRELIDPDSPFPNWSPHVTVDKEEKKKTIDTIWVG